MELFFLAAVMSAVIVAWWHWQNHVKLVPLEEFGLPVVRSVLSFEDPATQALILKRGSMTYAQWAHMNKVQSEALREEIEARR